MAQDLADICLLTADKEAQDVYNASGKDMLSIMEIVLAVADFYSLDKNLIHPVSSVSLKKMAKRTFKTGYNLDKTIRDLDYTSHSFLEVLRIMDKQLKELQHIA